MFITLFFVFIRKINGILIINQYILPILIVVLLFVLLQFTFDQKLALFSHWHEQRNWVAAFPFTALNILPLIAVLGAIGNKVESRKEIWIGCVGSGAILGVVSRSEEHTSELQSRGHLVCRLLLEKNKSTYEVT